MPILDLCFIKNQALKWPALKRPLPKNEWRLLHSFFFISSSFFAGMPEYLIYQAIALFFMICLIFCLIFHFALFFNFYLLVRKNCNFWSKILKNQKKNCPLACLLGGMFFFYHFKGNKVFLLVRIFQKLVNFWAKNCIFGVKRWKNFPPSRFPTIYALYVLFEDHPRLSPDYLRALIYLFLIQNFWKKQKVTINIEFQTGFVAKS